MPRRAKPFINKERALTYQVVHRSQRDPAIADESASKRVLKPVPTSLNHLKRGKGLDVPDVDYEYEEVSDADDQQPEDWDDELDEDADVYLGEDASDEDDDAPAKPVGRKAAADFKEDASMHGIFFKDQESYNYLQHLKTMGDDPTAVFLDAKAAPKKPPKSGIRFFDEEASVAMSEAPKRKVKFDIPSEVLASQYEDEVGMMNREAIPSVLEIEPSMREVFYALQDEAYVEEDLDDFFEALDAEELPEKFQAIADAAASAEEQVDEAADGEDPWKDYKRYRKHAPNSDDEYSDSEQSSRHPASKSDRMTNFSMTSSALFRNKHLTLLDDRFDEVMKEYEDEEEDYDEDGEPREGSVPALSQSRLDKIFDSFLDSTEVVGRKNLLLPSIDPLAQMDAVRRDLKGDAKSSKELPTVDAVPGGEELDDELEVEFLRMHDDSGKDRWDVETVLSTYSNIYNHPGLIKEVRKNAPKIGMRRGMPVVIGEAANTKDAAVEKADGVEDDSDDESNEDVSEDEEKTNAGQARSKNETKEEKKARKAAIKSLRKERRAEKKSVKNAFSKEATRQKKTVLNVVMQEKLVAL